MRQPENLTDEEKIAYQDLIEQYEEKKRDRRAGIASIAITIWALYSLYSWIMWGTPFWIYGVSGVTK